MNSSAIIFFALFAIVLWGGLAVCLRIALKKQGK